MSTRRCRVKNGRARCQQRMTALPPPALGPRLCGLVWCVTGAGQSARAQGGALLSRRVGPASRLQQLLLDAGQGVIHCLHCVGSDWVCCINAPAPVDVGHRSFSSIINGNLVEVQRRYSGWFGGLSHRAFSLTPSLFKIKIISHARHRESSPCVIAAVAAQGHNHEFCGIACPPLP